MDPIAKLLNYLKGNHIWTRVYKPNELTDPIAKAIKESGDKTAKQLEDVLSKVTGIRGEKGDPGKDGRNGKNGKDGYTPIKGLDYFDGKNGIDGKDGYTPIKGLDYFDGKNGIDGKDGKDGLDGHTPVKGKDYFTKKEIKKIIDEASSKAQVAKQTVYSLWQRAIGVKNLDDVDLTAPTNGQALTYSNGKWINSTISSGSVSDSVYDSSWNGDTTTAPSKNSVYDKIETLLSLGGITRTVAVTSGNYTAGSSASTDYVYLIAGAHTATLPAASGNLNRYTFKNNHSAAVTINRAGSDTIEGATSIQIASEDSVDLISDGTSAWYVI